MNPKDTLLTCINELINILEPRGKEKISVSDDFLKKWNNFSPYRFVETFSKFQSQEKKMKTEKPEVSELQKTSSVKPPSNRTNVHTKSIEIQQALNLINEEVKACKKCSLHSTRTQTVFGSGNPLAQLVFVGEAPGAEEDKQGLPFVGRAGQLLTDIIVKGMKMKREDVYICNVLKCRPPGNREPNPMEVFHCEPYLIRQLELIKPKVICALGRVAAQTLLKTNDSIEKLRGKWHNYHGIPLRVTYHPAYLLRNPADKKKAWLDIQEIMRLLKGEIEVKLDEISQPSRLF